MKTEMRIAESKLRGLFDAHERTVDLYVRVHGDHLILGRRESVGDSGQTESRTVLTLNHAFSVRFWPCSGER